MKTINETTCKAIIFEVAEYLYSKMNEVEGMEANDHNTKLLKQSLYDMLDSACMTMDELSLNNPLSEDKVYQQEFIEDLLNERYIPDNIEDYGLDNVRNVIGKYLIYNTNVLNNNNNLFIQLTDYLDNIIENTPEDKQDDIYPIEINLQLNDLTPLQQKLINVLRDDAQYNILDIDTNDHLEWINMGLTDWNLELVNGNLDLDTLTLTGLIYPIND